MFSRPRLDEYFVKKQFIYGTVKNELVFSIIMYDSEWDESLTLYNCLWRSGPTLKQHSCSSAEGRCVDIDS